MVFFSSRPGQRLRLPELPRFQFGPDLHKVDRALNDKDRDLEIGSMFSSAATRICEQSAQGEAWRGNGSEWMILSVLTRWALVCHIVGVRTHILCISNLAPASDSARLASLQRREEPRAEKSEAMIRHLDVGLFMKSGRGLRLVMPRCQGECICHLQQFPPGGAMSATLELRPCPWV